MRESNAEFVDIHGFGFGSGTDFVGGVVAIGEEVSETVRVHVAWVRGNVNWEKWFQ